MNPRPELKVSSSVPDVDRIFQEVMSFTGELPSIETSSVADQFGMIVQGVMLKRKYSVSPIPLPPLGRVPPYNPDKDVKEGYDGQNQRLKAQIDEFRHQGVPEALVLGFEMLRQAEIDQMYPRQAIRKQHGDSWRDAALLMRAKGRSPDVIRRYLKRKAAETKPPTPMEVKVFMDQRKEFASLVSDSLNSLGIKPAPPAPVGQGKPMNKPVPPPTPISLPTKLKL